MVRNRAKYKRTAALDEAGRQSGHPRANHSVGPTTPPAIRFDAPLRVPPARRGSTAHREPTRRFPPTPALDRLKQQMGRPVCPLPFQCEPDLSVSREFEPLLRNGRAQGIFAHALQAVPLPGRDANPGMEIETLVARMAGPESGWVGGWGRVTAAAHTPARARAERQPALHRGGRHSGQRRRLVGPGTQGAATLVRTTPRQQPLEVGAHRREEIGHVGRVKHRVGVKAHRVAHPRDLARVR